MTSTILLKYYNTDPFYPFLLTSNYQHNLPSQDLHLATKKNKLNNTSNLLVFFLTYSYLSFLCSKNFTKNYSSFLYSPSKEKGFNSLDILSFPFNYKFINPGVSCFLAFLKLNRSKKLANEKSNKGFPLYSISFKFSYIVLYPFNSKFNQQISSL
jgi:hypothetical protein